MRRTRPLPAETSPSPGFDPHRREAFEARWIDVLNGGALALMTSIGRRARLFEAMAALGPTTARHLARESGLDGGYVEGWLAVMAAGGVVLPGPGGSWRLPPEHAAHLTRDAGPDDLAVHCEALSHLARLEDDLLACFRDGGRLPEELFVPLPARPTDTRSGEEPPLAPFLHAVACARGERPPRPRQG